MQRGKGKIVEEDDEVAYVGDFVPQRRPFIDDLASGCASGSSHTQPLKPPGRGM